MVWKNKYEAAWEKGYQAALAYYNEHGNLDVPAMYVTSNGYRLGAWLIDRRESGKDKHTPEQQCLLDRLGMVWVKPNAWESRYALAKQYYDIHGDLNIPSGYKADGVWLSKWVNEQRQIYIGNRGDKRLTEDQVQRLEAIGMTWKNRHHMMQSEAWNNQYRAVKAFHDVFGHLNIPSDYESGKGKRLAQWLVKQRALKANNKLMGEQIALLDELGMVWSLEDPWEIGFSHAVEYCAPTEISWLPPAICVPTAIASKDGSATKEPMPRPRINTEG